MWANQDVCTLVHDTDVVGEDERRRVHLRDDRGASQSVAREESGAVVHVRIPLLPVHEDLLHAHPKVAEAAVIGLPDPASGERCCAVVVSRNESEPLGFEEMVTFLSEQKLMRQKIPEQLEQLRELPRNPTGKVLKQELRKRYASLATRSRVCDLEH